MGEVLNRNWRADCQCEIYEVCPECAPTTEEYEQAVEAGKQLAVGRTRYCLRCATLDAVEGSEFCGYCLQLSPEDRVKPFTQEEADTIRW